MLLAGFVLNGDPYVAVQIAWIQRIAWLYTRVAMGIDLKRIGFAVVIRQAACFLQRGGHGVLKPVRRKLSQTFGYGGSRDVNDVTGDFDLNGGTPSISEQLRDSVLKIGAVHKHGDGVTHNAVVKAKKY